MALGIPRVGGLGSGLAIPGRGPRAVPAMVVDHPEQPDRRRAESERARFVGE